MRKIRFLILAAAFALAGFSIVSCPGASPSGTAIVPEGAAALGGEWQSVTEENKSQFRFFKVEVVLP